MKYRFLLRRISPLLALVLIPLGHAAASTPLFVENRGQLVDTRGTRRPDLLYSATLHDATVYLRSSGFSFVFGHRPDHAADDVHMHRLDLDFVGASDSPRIVADGVGSERFNFYLPQCPDGLLGVRGYGRVTYGNLYPGIDLVVDIRDDGIEYAFVVHPGADPSRIRIRYDGADAQRLTADGEVETNVSLGGIRESAPVSRQGDFEVPSRWIVDSSDGHREARFQLGAYDHDRELTIDPMTRAWASYLGGTGNEIGGDLALWPAGSTLYVAGPTLSTDFPVTSGAFQTSNGSASGGSGPDAYIVRFTTGGSRVWSTYFGGSNTDETGTITSSTVGLCDHGIAVDSSGNVVIVGHTQSTNLPVTSGAYQTSLGGNADAFIAKFDSAGARQWATYLGGSLTRNGSSLDFGRAVEVDRLGNVVVTGETHDTNFPITPGAFQSSFAGGGSTTAINMFLSRFTSGGALIWSTYYGGSGTASAQPWDLALDDTGAIVVVGRTDGNLSATSGAYDTTISGADAFVVKFDTSGGREWTTFFGGYENNALEHGSCVALDDSNDVVIGGETSASGLPATIDTSQSRVYGSSDGFLAKFSGDGRRLRWARYVGGDSVDAVTSIAIDPQGMICLSGVTESSRNLPAIGGPLEDAASGLLDGFFMRLSANGLLMSSTYIGDTWSEWALGVQGGSDGNAYVSLTTASNGLTTTSGAFQTSFGGATDSYVVRIGCQAATPEIVASGGLCQNDPNSRVVLSTAAPNTHRFWSTGDTTATITVSQPGSYTVTVLDSAGCLGTSDAYTVGLNQRPIATIVAPRTRFCREDSVTLSGIPGFVEYLWSTGDSTQSIRTNDTGLVTLAVVDTLGCTSAPDSVFLHNYPVPAPAILESRPTVCRGDTATLTVDAPYVSYQWNTGATSRSIVVDDNSVYTVTVVDSNGCAGTSAPAQLSYFAQPSASITAQGATSFCYGDSVRLQATLGFVTYAWSNGDSTPSIVVHDSASYAVTVTDTNGCSVTSDSTLVEVLSLPHPTLTVSGDTNLCSGESVTLLVPGTFHYYHWSTGEETSNIVASDSGAYWVEVEAYTGCVGYSDTVVLNVHQRPVASIAGPGSVCADAESRYSVESQPGLRYHWELSGDGFIRTGADSSELTVKWNSSGSGQVRVIVTDTASGCTSGDTLNVTVGSGLVPRIVSSRPPRICPGDTLTLDAGPGYRSYQWTTGDTTRRISVANSGSYSVTVEDSTGCGGTSDPFVVEEATPPTPVIFVADGSTTLCPGDSVTLDAGGPYRHYTWSNGASVRRITVRSAGEFTVTVEDSSGCVGTSDPLSVSVYAVDSVRIDGPNSACLASTSAYRAAAPAGSGYQWTVSPSGTILSGQGTDQIQVRWNSPGPGFVHVDFSADPSGCDLHSDDYAVSVGDSLQPVVTPAGPIDICEGGSITLQAPAGYASYSWSTGATSRSIDVTSAGSYTVHVTDSSGTCGGTSDPVTVTTHPKPSPVISPAGPIALCADSSIVLSAPPGHLQYTWSTGESTPSITVADPGSYTVTVSDGPDCAGTSPAVSVTALPAPSVAIQPAGSVSLCQGDSLTLVATPGFDHYEWSTGDTAESITVGNGGNYSVSVVNSDGCRATADPTTVEIAPLPDAPTISVIGDTLFAAAPGGGSLQWLRDDLDIPGATDVRVVASTPGDYSVRITTDAGCSATSEAITMPRPVDQSHVFRVDTVSAVAGNPLELHVMVDPPFVADENVTRVRAALTFDPRALFLLSAADDDGTFAPSEVSATPDGAVTIDRTRSTPAEGATLLTLRMQGLVTGQPVNQVSLDAVSINDVPHEGTGGIVLLSGCDVGGNLALDRRARIESVRPNPVRDAAVIRWHAPVGEETHMVLVNVQGREVLDLALPTATGGQQTTTLTTRSIASGLYRLELRDRAARDFVTVMVVK